MGSMSKIARGIGIAGAWVLAVGACSTVPPTPPVPVPTAATASQAGVTVTLSVAARQLLAGDQTTAFLEIHNDSDAEVWFDQDTCLLDQGLSFTGSSNAGPVPTDSPGRAWDDPRLAWVKTTALANAVSVIGFRHAFPGADDIRIPLVCPVDAQRYGLPPGGVIRQDQILVARRTDGLPAWPGTYTAAFTFPTDQPIHVELPVDVIGLPYAGISRGQAIDAALSDQRVTAWLYQLGRSGIEDGDAWFDKDAWTITIRSWSFGQGTVTVDPTGKVTAVVVPA
jgi:hypothetical protein